MKKFNVLITVENPNSLYCYQTVEANSLREAYKKAEDIDLDGIVWQESEGNFIDTGEVQIEVVE